MNGAKMAQSTDRETVRLGAALSLTGRYASQGRQAWLGLRLWGEAVNRSGGLRIGEDDARPLQMIVYDDRSRTKRTAALYERLIARDRVNLLVGPYGSGATLAAARVAERDGRLLWNHGGATTALDEIDPATRVNVLSPTSRYFAGLIELCHRRGVGRSLALVHSPTGTFARTVIDGAERLAHELGFETTCTGTYPSNDEMPALAERVTRSRPDILLGAGAADQDIAFARALAACESRPPVVGLVAAAIERFADELEDADGFFGPSQWEEAVDYTPDRGPTSRQFAARYRERCGSEPDYPAAQSYATGLVIEHCLAQAGALDESALRAAAAAADLTTFYGHFKLDPTTGAQTGHQLVIIQRRDGAKHIVWPPDAANSEAARN